MRDRSRASLSISASGRQRQRYERVNRRKHQNNGIYCLHFYEGDKRRWETVGAELNAASAARLKKESELLTRSVEAKPSTTAPTTLEEIRTGFIHDKKTTFKKDGFPLYPDTITSYEKVTREFLDIIKRTLPGEITGQDLRDWIAKQPVTDPSCLS